jgi:hypothetical protein
MALSFYRYSQLVRSFFFRYGILSLVNDRKRDDSPSLLLVEYKASHSWIISDAGIE